MCRALLTGFSLISRRLIGFLDHFLDADSKDKYVVILLKLFDIDEQFLPTGQV